MAKSKKDDIQIKFVVDEEQKNRLDILAKQRELSVPQFAKLTALGVRITPSPVIKVSEDNSEEKELLEAILEHFEVQEDGKEVVYISSSFHKDLINKIKNYLKQ
ncbi:hypothetical protein [Streptomyces sp. NPDC003631]